MSDSTYVFFFGSCSAASWTEQSVLPRVLNTPAIFMLVSVCTHVCKDLNVHSIQNSCYSFPSLLFNDKTASARKEEGHTACRKADSACDNDRKDGRVRGGDTQPEVAGRPQHIAHWVWAMSLLLAWLQGSQLKQSPMTLNRPTTKREKKNMHGRYHS